MCWAQAVTADQAAQNFGARDPFEGEVKSNFGDKVLGNADTSHIVRRADREAALFLIAYV